MPEKSPVVVSIINLKGGVGKTTVTALLARHAAQKEFRTLAVDLDPQSNLSQALMTETDYRRFMERKEAAIVELFNGFLPPSSDRGAPAPLDKVTRKVGHRENLYLIPSRFDFSDNLIRSVNVDEKILARFISEHGRKFDLILIDCAPTESIITRAAYCASRYILIPMRTEFFSTIGLPLLRQSLKEFKSKNPNHAIDVCGVLINNSGTRWSPRGPHHRNARMEIREQAEKYRWPIMRHEMFSSRGYPKLMREEYPDYVGNARREFKKIAKEFMNTIDLQEREE